MNYLQFILFAVYVFAILSCGFAVFGILDTKKENFINNSLCLGEVFLIGSIFVIGEMMLLSVLGLYKMPFLWGIVLLQYGFILNQGVRESFQRVAKSLSVWSAPKVIFVMLLGIFLFRNCFFLVDVDSHSTYLFAQKLWLAKGSSILGDVARDMRVFVPHFNAVPYALGISVFGQETLFPQLVVVSWSIVALLLVYGYTSYRFNGWYGLSAVMFILFNDHFFYSGANQCCIINSALICFLFASVYNLLESRINHNGFRFMLALIFLSQLMANKIQMAYILLFITVLGFSIQPNLLSLLKEIRDNKKWLGVLLCSGFFMFLWYLKNYFATGVPTFPVLAGEFGVFNWTPEMARIFNKVFAGGIHFGSFIKYMTYLFVWPGIKVAKIIIMAVCFLPFILTISFMRSEPNQKNLFELGYWLGMSILFVMGLCLVSFVDPRHYRYGIAIFSFSAIFSINYVFRYCFNIKSRFICGSVLLIWSVVGCKIIFWQGGAYKRPTFEDNIKVISNQLHFDNIMDRYYPENIIVREEWEENKAKTVYSAWDTGVGGVVPLSSFLLPIRPQVGLWHTTVVKWDSYENEDLIVKDLKEYGLRWIMRVEGDSLRFLDLEEYAQEAVQQNRYPTTLFYNYGFPPEIAEIRY